MARIIVAKQRAPASGRCRAACTSARPHSGGSARARAAAVAGGAIGSGRNQPACRLSRPKEERPVVSFYSSPRAPARVDSNLRPICKLGGDSAVRVERELRSSRGGILADLLKARSPILSLTDLLSCYCFKLFMNDCYLLLFMISSVSWMPMRRADWPNSRWGPRLPTTSDVSPRAPYPGAAEGEQSLAPLAHRGQSCPTGREGN